MINLGSQAGSGASDAVPASQTLRLLDQYNVIDVDTGELVDIFDFMIATEAKIDPIVYLIDKLKAEDEICKARKRLYSDKQIKIKEVINAFRDIVRDQMIKDDEQKIKTPENTVFLKKSDILVYDAERVPEEAKAIRFKTDYLIDEKLDKFIKFMDDNDLSYSVDSRKVDESKLHPDLVRMETRHIVNFRKSGSIRAGKL